MKRYLSIIFLLNLSCACALTISKPGYPGINITEDTTKEADRFIRENIIGLWKDQNSLFEFKKNGGFIIIYDNPHHALQGWWAVKKSRLTISYNFPGEDEYHILKFTPGKIEFKNENNSPDQTLWIAWKIGALETKEYGSIKNEVSYDSTNITTDEINTFIEGLTEISYFDNVNKQSVYIRKDSVDYELTLTCNQANAVQTRASGQIIKICSDLQAMFPGIRLHYILLLDQIFHRVN